MCNITFLGPVGSTFSHEAYGLLARAFRAPDPSAARSEDVRYVPATSNGEILRLMSQHKGFGAIAMETLEDGRVGETLEAFIKLLGTYESDVDCPFHINGAVKMKIHFCLMAKPGTDLASVKQVVAHAKAFGPCRKHLAALGMTAVEVPNGGSNGEAARLVAEDPAYARFAALGPRCAAEKYGLKVLDGAFEDGEAVTTFFMLSPNPGPVPTGECNRVLLVFRLLHEPGALMNALAPFAEEGLNLIQIHSMHAGNGTYDFAIQIEARGPKSHLDYSGCQLRALGRAMARFEACTAKHIAFGPFSVLSR